MNSNNIKKGIKEKRQERRDGGREGRKKHIFNYKHLFEK